MSRYRAALIHLLISIVPIAIIIGVAVWVWYPAPSLEALDAISIIRVVLAVHLVLGPLLTLVVYKEGKRGLKFDLIVIALMQVAALTYGSYKLYNEKPDYLVFAVDRLEFIPGKQIDRSALRYEELRTKPFGELVYVFARPPEDPDEFQRYLSSVTFDGQPDLERRAEYWEPWAAGSNEIRSQLKSLDDIITPTAEARRTVQQAIDDYASAHPELGVLPIGGIDKDIGILLDQESLEILGVFNANPWPSKEE